jgi:hypothetical protein
MLFVLRVNTMLRVIRVDTLLLVLAETPRDSCLALRLESVEV